MRLAELLEHNEYVGGGGKEDIDLGLGEYIIE